MRKLDAALSYAGLASVTAAWLSLFALPSALAAWASHLPLEPSVPWVAQLQPANPQGHCLRSSVAAFTLSVIAAVALQLVVSVGVLLLAQTSRLRALGLVTIPLFQLTLFTDTLRVLVRDWYLYLLSQVHLFTLTEDSASYTHPLIEPRYPVLSGVALLVLLLTLRGRRTESSA
jgi:hypothetical protein